MCEVLHTDVPAHLEHVDVLGTRHEPAGLDGARGGLQLVPRQHPHVDACKEAPLYQEHYCVPVTCIPQHLQTLPHPKLQLILHPCGYMYPQMGLQRSCLPVTQSSFMSLCRLSTTAATWATLFITTLSLAALYLHHSIIESLLSFKTWS